MIAETLPVFAGGFARAKSFWCMLPYEHSRDFETQESNRTGKPTRVLSEPELQAPSEADGETSAAFRAASSAP